MIFFKNGLLNFCSEHLLWIHVAQGKQPLEEDENILNMVLWKTRVKSISTQKRESGQKCEVLFEGMWWKEL